MAKQISQNSYEPKESVELKHFHMLKPDDRKA